MERIHAWLTIALNLIAALLTWNNFAEGLKYVMWFTATLWTIMQLMLNARKWWKEFAAWFKKGKQSIHQ